MLPSLAKLHWNKPTAMRLAFTTKGITSMSEEKIVFIVKKSNQTLKQKKK